MELDPMATQAMPAGGAPLPDEDVLTRSPQSLDTAVTGKTRVKWHRCHVPREVLSGLNKRSNFLGFAQTLAYLGLLALNAGAAIYSFKHWPWYVTALLVFVNGHWWHFLINGFHELVHDSVFRTQWLNAFFLRVLSFLGWYNHHWFWASHTEHHKYTLHPPDDSEVVLPQKHELGKVWQWGLVNWRYPWHTLRNQVRTVMGWIAAEDKWTATLFPASDPVRRRAWRRWGLVVLAGHALIAAAAIAMGYWIVLLVVTFPMMFGGWLHFFCNASQHVGLRDNVPDFRLCCRTIYLNPFLQFLYWHMNYHTEHHMFAAVPCYKLGKLHRAIKSQMPHCPNGLWETWKHIAWILEQQKVDPHYQFSAQLPEDAATGQPR
jgi:fatty acid desaturase